MAVTISTLVNTDTFGDWKDKTNDLIDMAAKTLTIGEGETNSGNVEISGNLTVEQTLLVDTIQPYTAGPNTITFTGTVTATSFSGSGSGLTSIPASQLTGTVAAARLTGTYSINIDGNAATVTNGVYTTGNQTIGGTKTFSSTISGSINGNAATATTLQTARTINGVSFNGSGNIVIEPYIEDDDGTNATRHIVFTDNSTAGYKRLNEDSSLTYNPSTNTISATTFNGALSGNAATATKWATGRTIALTGDVTGTSGSFDGSGNLSFSTNIASNVVGADELNVTGDGLETEFLRSNGDGSFTWDVPDGVTAVTINNVISGGDGGPVQNVTLSGSISGNTLTLTLTKELSVLSGD